MEEQIAITSNRPYLIRAIHQWLLDNSLTPHLLVNATLPNVKVPLQFVKDGHIVLNIVPHAISNLHMDNEAISFSARFSGVPESLYLPIHAVQAIYASENGEGISFPDENIDEQQTTEKQSTDLDRPEQAPKEESAKSKLESVELDENKSEIKAEDKKKSKDNKSPFLKVIK